MFQHHASVCSHRPNRATSRDCRERHANTIATMAANCSRTSPCIVFEAAPDSATQDTTYRSIKINYATAQSYHL